MTSKLPLALLLAGLAATPAMAQAPACGGNFAQFLEGVKAEAMAKGVSGDAAALPAAAALKMATLDAARALNLDDRIGSIVPGKRADLVAVDLRDFACQPVFDPVSHLVYVAGREHVTHVWVDGTLKVDDRRLVSLDTDDLTARAAYWRGKLTA